MARPYAVEMSKLAETLSWAMSYDITALRQAVKTAGLSSLMAIGSGGSLTAAHALASLHRRRTGHLAAVATPLVAIAEPVSSAVSNWLLSAGGSNIDILAAFRALVLREPRQLGILCGNAESPLAAAARAHPFTDLVVCPPPTGKDGFLATNSLLAFATLLARSYVAEFGRSIPTFDDELNALLGFLNDAERWDRWRTLLQPAWARRTTLVLYGPTTHIGAVDLESKFTEAALGNLQVADYRNFAHGRHHWLAKRAEESAIVAFVSAEDQGLADKTLALLPASITQVRLPLAGSPETAMLASLVAALKIAGWAGEARDIDPGRPGVPDFGRKLYHLAMPEATTRNSALPLGEEDVAAIERKACLAVDRLGGDARLRQWGRSLSSFRLRLAGTRFAGAVLDYDGTLVDTRRRFSPPSDDIASELSRIVSCGGWIGIATGRGMSVKRDLRAVLSRECWDRVLVGYYNGAEIAPLSDDSVPAATDEVCEELAVVAAAFRSQMELMDIATQTDRRYQITLQARHSWAEMRLWDLAQQTLILCGQHHLSVMRSSHSVDVVAPNVSKVNVLRQLQTRQAALELLAIGDRGRWPGNDYELLQTPFALSVDESSVDPDTCWNLAPRGQRGVAVALRYLRALVKDGDSFRFDLAMQ